MGFLIRSAFWLSLVLLAIPFGGTGANGETVGPIPAFSAAREAIGDVSGMCERKPEVCATGKVALETLGVRAREASRIAYELLDERFGEPDRQAMTGTVPSADEQAVTEATSVN